MNQGVEMILKRIESNPEEFWIEVQQSSVPARPSKWEWLIRDVFDRIADLNPKNETMIRNARYPSLPYLTNEEVSTIYEALMLAQGKSFTSAVMNTLLNDPLQDKDVVSAGGQWNTAMVSSTKRPYYR